MNPRTETIVKLAVPIAGIGCAVALVAWMFTDAGRLRFVRNITGVRLPDGIADVDINDDGRHKVEVHVRLRREDVAAFEKEYGFAKDGSIFTTNTNLGPIPIRALIRYDLKPENRHVSGDCDLTVLHGRGDGAAWLYSLDRNSGRLWIFVYYKDQEDDIPKAPAVPDGRDSER